MLQQALLATLDTLPQHERGDRRRDQYFLSRIYSSSSVSVLRPHELTKLFIILINETRESKILACS